MLAKLGNILTKIQGKEFLARNVRAQIMHSLDLYMQNPAAINCSFQESIILEWIARLRLWWLILSAHLILTFL